jgi:CHAD domain-containing protein
MPADKAVRAIYLHLLEAIKANEKGTINALDSEFLHNFRVAVRRTRSALSQLKGILPAKVSSRYSEYFAWLGEITCTSRDLDVYLLSFNAYKAKLPKAMRKDLEPLQQFLKVKQAAAQKELSQQLTSAKYLAALNKWEQYLQKAESKTCDSIKAKLSIKQLADVRIYKVYQRVIKQGTAINDSSLPSDLHDLRKTCKKLRYLLEFFQSLYSATKIKMLIKALKGLQECLGEFQDLAVQEQALKQFSAEMVNDVPDKTFAAIGALIQVLDGKRNQARSNFEGCFTAFNQPRNQALFQALFVSK